MRKWIALIALTAIAVAACAGTETTDSVAIEVHDAADAGEAAAVAAALRDAVACFPAGEVTIGSDSGAAAQRPAHEVLLDAFCVGRFEVTNAEYAAFAAEVAVRTPPHWTDGDVPDGALDLPVVGVAWDEADEYCRWAGGRLPTEAEWERACRGTEGRRFPWGNEWDAACVNVTALELADPAEAWPGAAGDALEGEAALRPVGSMECGATPEGVMDLVGNASEWVADWYDPNAYSVLPADNPIAPGPTWSHAVRGFPWLLPVNRPDDIPDLATCTVRNASHVDRSARTGFRCVFDDGE